MRGLRVSAFKRLWTNDKGAGAVEFALVAPVLLLLCIGGPEITVALLLSKKVNHAASAVGDLVTRESQVSVDSVDSMLEASRTLVQPYGSGPFDIVVTSLQRGTNGSAKVVWSRAIGTERRRAGTFIELDHDLMASAHDERGLDGIVMVETSYSFRPLSGFLAETPYELAAVAYSAPRAGSEVRCSDC